MGCRGAVCAAINAGICARSTAVASRRCAVGSGSSSRSTCTRASTAASASAAGTAARLAVAYHCNTGDDD